MNLVSVVMPYFRKKAFIKQSIINFVYGQNKIYLRMHLLIFTKNITKDQ